ncbi:DUF2178 domain-containing protein [Lactococcus cremoris]|uniref:DUF2178 domain-containing protein n=1 Tax=Lactococcus lactis TaxID=1358 RepID=O87234_9LACT|nr:MULTISPECIES: hypothetical protein [Lactococcus]AAC56038.1 L. lactis predicted coding region ORF00033 [Lactococcus lactis]MDR9868643.1 DUF2178 domain-containing protein [Lactococcus cremoris]
MKNENINTFSESLFYSLKEWAEGSANNYNILLGLSFIFVMSSVVFFVTISTKIGKKDERTTKISLYSAYCVLITLIICDIIFPKGYLIQPFFMLKYGFSCLVGGIYCLLKYIKDNK